MGFRDNDDMTRFDLVRVDRLSGKTQVVPGTKQIAGRWQAEEACRRLQESNRDPNVHFEVKQLSGPVEKSFMASSVADVTGMFKRWDFDDEPEKQG